MKGSWATGIGGPSGSAKRTGRDSNALPHGWDFSVVSAGAFPGKRKHEKWRKRVGVEPTGNRIACHPPVLKTGTITGPHALPLGQKKNARARREDWPTPASLCQRYHERGCTILAFFARVGTSNRFSEFRGHGPVEAGAPHLSKTAKDGAASVGGGVRVGTAPRRYDSPAFRDEFV